MALLRPCCKFIRLFTKMSTSCRSRNIEKCILHLEFRGYVYPIHNASYRYNSETKQWPAHNNNITHVNNNNNSKEKVEKNNKKESDFPTDLSDCLDILNVGFYNMKVDYDVVLKALRMYAETSLDTDEIGILFLKCCGEVMPDIKQELRQELADRVWKILEGKNPELSLIYYDTYLHICAQNCTIIDPAEFIKSMKILPDENTYRCLLNVAARNGDLESFQFILMAMKEKNYSVNYEVITALIELCARRNDMKSIHTLFENLTSSKVETLNAFSGELDKDYAIDNEIENVSKLLKSHPNEYQHLLIIMRTLSLSGDGKNIEKLFKLFPQRPEIISDPLLHNVVIELVHSNKLDDALMIMNFFLYNHYSKENISLTAPFLRAIVSAKIPNEMVLDIGRKFYKRCSSLNILHTLLEQSLRSSNTDLSLLLLEEMKNENLEIRPHYYWPLLKLAYVNEGETGVLKMLQHIKRMHVSVDYQTLLDYVIPYINQSFPRETLKLLRKHDIPMSVAFESLGCYLLQNGQISQTLSLFTFITNARTDPDRLLFSLMKAYKITEDIHSCVKVLKLVGKSQNYGARFLLDLVDDKSFRNDIVNVLKRFVDAYGEHRIYISSRDAELISERISFCYSGTLRVLESVSLSSIVDERDAQEENATCASYIQHPREMSETQLESHLIELQSKRMKTRGVLRKLFMLHCKNGNLQRVEQLQQLLKQSDVTLTFGMKARLLELYAHNGCIDEMRNVLVDLKQNHAGSKIDASKVLYVAIAFAKQDKVEMALEIIAEHGQANFKMDRGCWKLLDAIANSTHGHLVEAALESLVENGYCGISTVTLGPLVRRHLLKDDISSAVNVFTSVASKYGETPLHRELVITLIEKSTKDLSDNEELQAMLQDVLELISIINGKKTAVLDSAVGYARCGLTEELRTALENLNLSQISIDEFTIGMSDEMKIRVLTSLLEVGPGVIDSHRHSIYELLIFTYCDIGKCQVAINLRRKMDAEGIIASTVANEVLLKSLLRHQVQISSDLKLCSKQINSRVDNQ